MARSAATRDTIATVAIAIPAVMRIWRRLTVKLLSRNTLCLESFERYHVGSGRHRSGRSATIEHENAEHRNARYNSESSGGHYGDCENSFDAHGTAFRCVTLTIERVILTRSY